MSRRKKILVILAALVVVSAATLWKLTEPDSTSASELPAHIPDAGRGKILYFAAGCGSCHQPASESADQTVPSGGKAFKTPVGVFYPKNLTPDVATGIGGWSDLEFINAVQRGISRDGQNLVPALPYGSYARMNVSDVLDIRAYLKTLNPVVNATPGPEIPMLYFVRRGVGLWKRLAFSAAPWTPDPAQSPVWNRGSYLVNGPGHCAECHTPRNALMMPDQWRALMGGPHPDGEGKVPSLHNLIGPDGFTDIADLASALQSGETMGYEHMSAGGMGEVQTNLSHLPESDLLAIATYLASLDKKPIVAE